MESLIKITDDPDEMLALGRQIVAENPVRYSPAFIQSLVDKYREFIADEDELRATFYRAIYAQVVYGTSIIEYTYYDFPQRTHAEKANYVTWYSRYAYLTFLNAAKDTHLLDNKFEAYEKLKSFYRREAMLLADERDFDAFCAFATRHPRMFVKPVNLELAEGTRRLVLDLPDAAGTRDACPYRSTAGTRDACPYRSTAGTRDACPYRSSSDTRDACPYQSAHPQTLASQFAALLAEARNLKSDVIKRTILPQLILEEEIVPSAAIAQFNPADMSVLRVPTVLVDGEVHFFYPCFRMMCGDGSTQRGEKYSIDALIDAETGRLVTGGKCGLSDELECHPVTGVPIKGFQMPEWSALREMLTQAARQFPTIRYIGWDVVHTDRGWCIIEGNPGGEFFFQLCVGHGVRDEFEKLIGFKLKLPAGFRWDVLLRDKENRGAF